MFILPFEVGPGIEEEGIKYITHAGYIKGSFVFVDTLDELNAMLSGQDINQSGDGYSLQEGTPIYVASEGKLYKYKKESEAYNLNHFDFLKDLEPDKIYAWQNNSWVDVTSVLETVASQEDIEQLREDLTNLFTKALQDETLERKTADLEIKNSLYNSVDRLDNLISKLNTAVQEETNRAIEEEKKLQSSLDEETNRATAKEAELESSIDTESKTREEQDIQIKDSLQQLSNKTDNSISALTNSLEVESNRATAQEKALKKSVEDEQNRALQSESALQSNIDEENRRATEAEINLQSSITSLDDRIGSVNSDLTAKISDNTSKITEETNRAKNAESDLKQDISQETARAKQAELNLQQQINAEAQIRATIDNTLTNNINEVARDLTNETTTRQAQVANETAQREEAIREVNETIDDVKESINEINEKIPNQASKENQLADKDFVNSSINNMAAFYITRDAEGNPFLTNKDLTTTTPVYSGGVERTPTNNDYAIVQADEKVGKKVPNYETFTTVEEYVNYYILYNDQEVDVNEENKNSLDIVPGETVAYLSLPTTRYTYQQSQWEYQYTINRTALTAAQIAAINSNITAELTAQITTNKNNIETNKKNLEDEIKRATGEESRIETSITTKLNETVASLNVVDTAIDGQYVSAVSQADGKIRVERTPLPTVEGNSPIAVNKTDNTITISHEGNQATTTENNDATTFISKVTTNETGHVILMETTNLNGLIIDCGTAESLI